MNEQAKTSNTAIETIGAIKLKNQGGFVVKLECYHRVSEFASPDRKGSTGDITLGYTKELDLGGLGLKDGDQVTAYANVVWGKDNHGNVWFTYEKGNPRVAKFTISGTTLDNEMGFNGIE